MNKLFLIFRLIRIQFTLYKYGLDKIILSTPWFWPIRFLSLLNPWGWFLYKNLTQGERVRKALEDLGPLFIKFGQILSTRYDVLPEDILQELSRLQDRVSPFSSQKARTIIEKAFKKEIHVIFQSFSDAPLASASIAQVHAATLHNGKEVVVKLLRPGIKKEIQRDLKLLRVFANLLERYWKPSRHFKPKAMVEEIEMVLLQEIDFSQEASNASQLRRNMANSRDVYIPEIFWNYCKPKVIVMERISGIPITDTNQLVQAGVNLKAVAHIILDIYFTQVFRDRFFHGDLHPGNIFIDAKSPEQPKLVLVDFGMAGSLNESDQRYIAENMLAFLKQDYQKVARLHVESGWVPSDTRIDQFEAAIRTVCEPIIDKSIKDVSFGQILMKLLSTAQRFQMNIQPQFIILQRTLLNVEGLCRRLDPDLNMWDSVQPIVERWLRKQTGVKALVSKVKENLPQWIETAPDMPALLHHYLLQTPKRPSAESNLSPKSYKLHKGLIGVVVLLLIILSATAWHPTVPVWGMEGMILISIMLLIGVLVFT